MNVLLVLCVTKLYYLQGTTLRVPEEIKFGKRMCFIFAEFGKLKCVHHTIDTYSGLKWATALNSEKVDSVITHLLDIKGYLYKLRQTMLQQMSLRK